MRLLTRWAGALLFAPVFCLTPNLGCGRVAECEDVFALAIECNEGFYIDCYTGDGNFCCDPFGWACYERQFRCDRTTSPPTVLFDDGPLDCNTESYRCVEHYRETGECVGS
jgi:hypothetical protein